MRALLAPLLVSITAIVVVACAHEERKPLNVNVPASRSEEPHSESDLLNHTNAPGGPDQVGLATWYGKSFAGKRTSNGERFDPEAMTAAHRTFPFGTWVEVRRPDTGSSVRVRINDRGPWGDNRRVIDLSYRAAERLGIVAAGSARVELRVVHGPE